MQYELDLFESPKSESRGSSVGLVHLSSAVQLTQALASTLASAVREQVTTHSATTDAAAGDVWDLMSSPASWPSFDPRIARIEGTSPAAGESAHLMAVTRFGGLRLPVDVENVRVGQSLTTMARILPGLNEIAEHQIVPVASGGTKIVSRVRASGPLGPIGAVPTWIGAEVVVRLLAWRAGRVHQEVGSPGAAATASAAST